MIKKMILKNFESHENSEIEFSDGLNLIIGQSNQGKSSIVRALAVVVANRFDKESVRTGKDFCSITVMTEKGSVTAERGEDTNHWIIETPDGKKKEYWNIGTTTPPEVLTVLGMGERVHGEIKELPNIMFQLEKHYMLSEIDGKKATSNMIARMMDEAIGIGGMEELIKDIATDFASKKKELGTKNIQISELKSEIIDDTIFNDYQKAVSSAKDAMREVESLNDLLESSGFIAQKVIQNQEELKQINERINVSDGLDELSRSFFSGVEKLTLLESIVRDRTLIDEISSRISLTEGVNILFDEISDQVKKFSLLNASLCSEHNLRSIEQRLSSFADYDPELQIIRDSIEHIEKAEKMLFDARSLYKKIRGIKNRIIDSQEELKKQEEKFALMKESLKVCPLCGGKL